MKRLFVLCAALLFCFFAAGTSSAFAQTEPSGNPDTNVEEPSSENKTEDENAADDRDAQNAGSAQSTQTEEDSADIQSDVVYKMNQPGDQFIILKLNVDIPYVPFGKLLVGGSGTLGYQRFIVSGLTLGGDVSFGYSQTLGKNVFYFVPILFRAGWQFSAGKFEFPLSIGIGGAFENYLNRGYFGLALHPDAAAFFRYDSSWSFGLHAGLYILPQWYKNTAYNRTGIIQDIGLTVRYHF